MEYAMCVCAYPDARTTNFPSPESCSSTTGTPDAGRPTVESSTEQPNVSKRRTISVRNSSGDSPWQVMGDFDMAVGRVGTSGGRSEGELDRRRTSADKQT